MQVGGTDTELVLKTLRKIGGCSEADIVCHLGNILACGEQKLVTAVQTGGAEQFDGRGPGDGLHLALELHTAEVHGCCQIIDTQVAVA